ncbi:MAG: hypothetical protein AB1509_16265 [Chloroflexota bacterium]
MTTTTLQAQLRGLQVREQVREVRESAPVAASSSSGSCAPDCSVCGGVGYVRYDVPVGHPKFGKVEMCPHARRLAFERSLDDGSLDPRIGLRPDEVQSLHWGLIQDGISDGQKARSAAQSAHQTGHGVCFLYGKSGQAKTLALKIAVATALRDGKTAAYANMLSVLDDIRLAFDARENKQTELVRRMEWWQSLDVLAIDELDKVNSTDWALERMFQLIDARYQRAVRQEALTFIAANYGSSLNELSDYLRSRIEDNRFAVNGWVVYLNGPDGRKVMPPGWKY